MKKGVWVFAGAMVLVAGIIAFAIYKASDLIASKASDAAAAQGTALGKSAIDTLLGDVGGLFGGHA